MGIKRCSNCGKNVKFPDGAPVWVTSYGDMVTNLLAFFVALLSFATFDAKKFDAAVEAMQVTFGVGFLESGASVNLTERTFLNAGDTRKPLGEQQDPIMSNSPEAMGWMQDALGKDIDIERTEDGLKIRIADSLLFGSGSAQLRPEAAPVMGRVASFLSNAARGHDVKFEGHSDDIDFFSALASRDNLSLSCERAMAVYRAVGLQGIGASRMMVAGFGAGRPLRRRDGETTEEYRSRNRRVEIVVAWQSRDTGTF